MHFLSLLSGLVIEKAYAASNAWEQYCSVFGTYCGDGRSFLIHVADRVSTIIFSIIGGGAVAAVIYGAIKLTLVGYNESGKEEAKKIITAALFGLVFAIMSWAVIEYVIRLVSMITGG